MFASLVGISLLDVICYTQIIVLENMLQREREAVLRPSKGFCRIHNMTPEFTSPHLAEESLTIPHCLACS